MEEEENQSVRVDISNLFCYSCSTQFLNLDNFKSHQCHNVSKSTTTSTSPTKKSSSSPIKMITTRFKKKSDTKPKFFGRVKGGNGKSVVVKSKTEVNITELQDYMHCCRCYTTFYKLLDLIKHFKDCQVQKQTSETFQESKTQKKNQDEWSVKIVSMLPGQTTFRLEQTKNNVESNTNKENIHTNTSGECLKSPKVGETKSLLETSIQIQAHEDSLNSPNSPNSPPSPIHQDSETETAHDNNNIDIDVPSPSSSIHSLPEIKEEEEENSEVEKEDEGCPNNNNNNNNNSPKRKRVKKSMEKKKPKSFPRADPSNIEFPFLTCSTCFRIFNRPGDMKKHELQHGQRTLKCIECPLSIRTRNALYRHMKKKHPGAHPYRCYRYPTCPLTFATKEELSSHMKSHTPKRYYCPEPGCTRSYSTHALIIDHLNSHKNLRPHICDKCAAPFETLVQLKTHLIRHRIPTYKCDFEGCSKLFKSATQLKHHQVQHSSERPYKCTESGCEVSFCTENLLKRHDKIVHKREYENLCPFCGKSFLTKGQIKRHLLTHSEEKNVHCTFEGCSSSFHHKEALQRHMTTHTGERNHKCRLDSCDRKFASSSTRLRHEQTHSQAKPYGCKFCPEAFYDNYILKRHVLSYHEGEEFDITVTTSYRAPKST